MHIITLCNKIKEERKGKGFILGYISFILLCSKGLKTQRPQTLPIYYLSFAGQKSSHGMPGISSLGLTRLKLWCRRVYSDLELGVF